MCQQTFKGTLQASFEVCCSFLQLMPGGPQSNAQHWEASTDCPCPASCTLQSFADASSIPRVPQGTHAVLVTGTLKASKGRDAAEHANNVLLLLAVLRFPQHETDLLVSVNAPLFVSSADVAAGVRPAAQEKAAAVMQGVLASLCVQDWGLLGG
jgi:hypothetical protein